VLVVTVITPLRLHKSLASERQGARGEVVAVVKAINRHVPQARIAGFHDLPVNVPAMIMVAKDIGIPLRQGTLSYHPGDFDLDNAQADESASPELLAGIANRLALIKKLDDAVLLPTAATEFRLWQGLFSHRQLPQIRDQLIADPTFEQMEPIGPVQEVYFDIFLVRKEADAAKSP
jgi:hypothetical protein